MSFASEAQEMYYVFTERSVVGVSQQELRDATYFSEIHERYHADWIAEYLTTDIAVVQDGMSSHALGSSGTLTSEQKELLANAPVGSSVLINVEYLPANNLSKNEPKRLDYVFTVVPTTLAEYPGGEASRNTYLDASIAQVLTDTQRDSLEVARLQFTISADGSVEDVKLMESSGDAATDAILIGSFCNMPAWKPGKTADNENVAQSVIFFISKDFGSCLANGPMY